MASRPLNPLSSLQHRLHRLYNRYPKLQTIVHPLLVNLPFFIPHLPSPQLLDYSLIVRRRRYLQLRLTRPVLLALCGSRVPRSERLLTFRA
jgi:hypothetical protein